SELTRRIIFAVIAAPASVAIVYWGDWALAIVLSVLAALAAWEFFRMARETGALPLEAAGIALAALLPIAVHAQRLGVYTLSLTAIVAMALVLFASTIWLRGPTGKPVSSVSITAFGVLYAGVFAYIYALRYHDYAVGAAAGTALVFLPIFLTWTTDVGAYAFGRMFGRKKLIPSVSPGKTVEGAVGGLGLTIVICLLYVRFILMPYAQLGLTIQGAVLFAIVVSVAAQTGDLAESLLKREAGVKDSSSILPGHGGILDRFDALLFVMPIAFLLLGRLLLPIPQ
ncbi:MAG TPA: phosphatidate cytidylyltransferase, partial [Gemmatimonadaceae bacterium]|nr:phosphatidate cytidylyltransferase [Gemmatimonadaceae bacterium]